MNISYKLSEQKYFYNQDIKEEIKKLNFLLTNNKGDFLNFGAEKNSTKFQGLNLCNSKTLEVYKIIDEILLEDLEVDEVEYGGYYIKRYYKSKLSQQARIDVEDISQSSQYDEDSQLVYSDDGKLEEMYEDENEIIATDRFYLAPSGGMIYEVDEFYGNIKIDLDMKKIYDFDIWGRDYNIYKKDSVLMVEYTKKNENSKDYKIYFGVKAINFDYELLKEWIEKEYLYSKQRNSLNKRHVFRLFSTKVDCSKKIMIGFGMSEYEVMQQIDLLEKHHLELENFDREIYNDLTYLPEFETPMSSDFLNAYKITNYSMYKFLNKNLENEKIKSGSFAGFPWFSKIWVRDELTGLRGLINNDEYKYVKDKIFEYIYLIDENDGLLKRIINEDSFKSPDGIFWLAKRIEDFIFHIDEKNKLNDIITEGELNIIYEKLYNSFQKITQKYWDREKELLKPAYGDSWMDTIDLEYPLDIQVQFLEFVSLLAMLSKLLKKDNYKSLEDFEDLLKNKIRNSYFRDGYLYNELDKDKITSNVFLSYYFYPNLFDLSIWEQIIDNSLIHLKTQWGGISSLSKKDDEFKENYTGENNLSYHRGDVWIWINNITAIVLNDVNEKKYRKEISQILLNSTNDILKLGTIGFSSEISSASSQSAQGCFAQLWSSTTYLEMMDKIFKRK